MVLLVVGGASVAGATELAVCDSTGMGASGILHALFGFARLAKRKLPQLSLVAGLMGDARLRSRRDGKLRARA
jgi:hypothetical protein